MENLNEQALTNFGKALIKIATVCLLITVFAFSWFIFVLAVIVLFNAFLAMIMAKVARNINENSLWRSGSETNPIRIKPEISIMTNNNSNNCCEETRIAGRYYCACGQAVINQYIL